MSELSRILDALCHVELALEGATRDLEAHLEQVAPPASVGARISDLGRHLAHSKLHYALRHLGEALGDLRQSEEMDAREQSSAADREQA